MSDENSELDLFGDPIVAAKEGRGRPEHIWTLRNSNKVLLVFARRGSKAEAAAAIGISVRTLEKHYLRELAYRHDARVRFEAEQMYRLNEQAKAGNVTADKELRKMLERSLLEELDRRIANRSPVPAQVKPAKLGKKEAATAAAAGVKGKFAPPDAPLLN